MTKDNGKIRIEIRDGVPIIEIYHNGEIGLSDATWLYQTLHYDIDPPLQPPVDVIFDRTGSYSLSADTYMNMKALMKESNRVAYVIHTPAQEIVVDFAANSYLSDKKVRKFSSIEGAFQWLQSEKQENGSKD